MPLPINADCADLCSHALLEAKRANPGGLRREDISAILRPIIEKYGKELLGGAQPVKRTRATVSRSIPPTAEDVSAYSEERGYPLDGARWCDYYASKGWIVSGRARMVDWRAAVRNWQANGWGQDGPHPIALKKLPPKPIDPRYAPEPQGDWRQTARTLLAIDELPEGWTSWEEVPPDYRGKIIKLHTP